MRIFKSVLALAFVLAAPPMFAQQFRVTSPTVHIISAMGAKCLDIEGGNFSPGTRVILWDCGVGKQNQEFAFLPNGQIRAGFSNMCLDDKGGMYRPMDQIVLWPCASSSSRWRFINGQLLSPNNMCVDLRGGQQRWYLGNQDAILYPCNGQANQHYVAGMEIRRGNAGGFNPGQIGQIVPRTASSTLSFGASGVIAAGGGNVIAAGAGNIVASGAGNIVASGAGNIVASGAGNIVASGAGNVIVPVGNSFQ